MSDTSRPDAAAAPAPLEPDAADGVFEGGGVKGIALVGALEAAREHGIERWVNVAGTSAGAIVASLLAVGYEPADLRRILEATDYRRFADYGWGGKYVGGLRNALRGRGVCPGRAFSAWLREQLAASPCRNADATFADVERRDLPGELSEAERSRARYRLRVIASDVTEGRMLVLPDDIAGYDDEHGNALEPSELSIADAVRMSMSFPYFFEPAKLYKAGRVHYIVDGGVLSNFPVFLFDGERPPLRRWTFGFTLYGGRPPKEPIYRPIPWLWPVPLGKAMFFAAMDTFDNWTSKATAARTIDIPTGSISTLKFELTDAEREGLRRDGFDAARRFFTSQRRYVNHAGVEAAGPAAV